MFRFIARRAVPRIIAIAVSLLFAPVLLLSTGCAVGAGAALNSPLDQQQAQTSTGVVGAQFFGMVVRSAGATPQVALGSRRLWDSGVSWADLEPAPGVFTWATLDAEVSAARQQGQQVVLTLGMTPQWASSSPSQASAYGSGATAMPANLANWDTYVAAVAARYAGEITAYEVWNSPEDSTYWSGDPTQMPAELATLAQHASAAVHAADSSALVVSPALSSAGLAAFLSDGGGASVNAVGAELDTPGDAPEQMVTALTNLRQTLSATSAAGKPVWNEQAAWQLPAGGLSDATQAAYVARAVVLNAGYGVARMHWYAWDDTTSGSLALSNGTAQPTEAAVAYAAAENWLAGAQMNGCSASASGIWTCQLVRGGTPAWIVWSPTGSAVTSTYGATTETDLDGDVTGIDGKTTIEAGSSPVLLQ